ncbi:MAG: hypothetical protein J7K61_02570 [Thermoplasmata archaeon]|nr:hypothetical protein [Thermoplasmata archaeon]
MKGEIIEHIINQKDMLYRKENIQKYIDMVEKKIFIRDTFDRAIASIFELVIEKQINPKEIDLTTFSHIYLEKIEREGINLGVAGKILLLAWKILKMQSEEIIRDMEMREEDENNYIDDIPDWYGDDDAFNFTRKVIENDIPIMPKIRRNTPRKITLVELINAFEEAKEEMKHRKRKRKTRKIISPSTIGEHAHKEDIEKDLSYVMKKISKLNGKAVPLKSISDGRNMISILLPVLFLAKEGVLEIWQENFPYGDIYIRVKHGNKENS